MNCKNATVFTCEQVIRLTGLLDQYWNSPSLESNWWLLKKFKPELKLTNVF
jgi:hypothetical protein